MTLYTTTERVHLQHIKYSSLTDSCQVRILLKHTHTHTHLPTIPSRHDRARGEMSLDLKRECGVTLTAGSTGKYEAVLLGVCKRRAAEPCKAMLENYSSKQRQLEVTRAWRRSMCTKIFLLGLSEEGEREETPRDVLTEGEQEKMVSTAHYILQRKGVLSSG